MQTRGGLVQDIDRTSRGTARKLGCELDSLRLAARERGRGLPDLDVAKTNVIERLQLALNGGKPLKEGKSLLHRHFQNVINVFSFIVYVQRIAVIALSLADVAGDVNVGQKVHLDAFDAVALAGLTASALDVKGEASRLKSLGSGVARLGKELADIPKEPRVGGRIGARRAPDGALVDADHLVQMLQPLDRAVLARVGDGAVELFRQNGIENAVDERGFSRTRKARDAHETAQGNIHVQILQIVLCRSADRKHVSVARAARFRNGDPASSREVVSRDGGRILLDLLGRSRRHDQAAVNARTGANIKKIIGVLHRLLVMLHHDHGVADVAQALQRGDKLGVVALMQTDARLVQNIQHAHKRGADLRGQTNALRLTARERSRLARKGQIVKTHADEEAQPRAHLLEDLGGDRALGLGQGKRVDEFQRLLHRKRAKLVKVQPSHRNGKHGL